MLKRYSGKELHEHSWFPALWRDQLTDFLSFFNIYSGTYGPALKRMQDILRDPDMPSVCTDICAGCGLCDWRFAQYLSKQPGTVPPGPPHRSLSLVPAVEGNCGTERRHGGPR